MSGALAGIVGPAIGVVDISGGGGSNDTVAAGTADSTTQFESDGDIVSITSSSGTVDVDDWIVPKAAAPGAYEIMAHLNSGDTPTGTLDTWQALTSNRAWNLQQTGSGSKTANLTISIRLGSTVLSSGTFIIEAIVL